MQEFADYQPTSAPPPYQQPPSYYNTQLLEQPSDDPFDTSRVFSPEPRKSYTQLPMYSQPNETKQNGYIKSDITNRSVNYKSTDVQLATSKGVSAAPKEIATPVSITNDLSLMTLNEVPNNQDTKFVQDLEKYLLTKTEIPPLQPPPPNLKAAKKSDTAALPPKVQNGTYSNLEEIYTKGSKYDTTNVFNQIWYENFSKENGNVKQCKNFDVPAQSSQNYYHHYDPVSDFDRASLSGVNFYDNCHTAADNLYNSSYLLQPTSSQNSFSSCNTQTGVYGSYNSIRQYSEVPDAVYAEIAETPYSQVPQETLKPHRPAPPSPMVQSMQQIQRKIQQGQVTNV